MKLLQATLYTGSASYTTAVTTKATTAIGAGIVSSNGASSSGSSSGSSRYANNNPLTVADVAVATSGTMVPAIDGAAVTEHVVDVVAALATRARTLLLSPLTLLQDTGTGTSTATTTMTEINGAMDVGGDGGAQISPLPLEFELHEHTVRLLWQWSRDGSGTTHPLDLHQHTFLICL